MDEVKIVKQTEFVDGVCLAIGDDDRLYIMDESGKKIQTRHQNFRAADVDLVPFQKGVAVALHKDHQVNPYMSNANYHGYAVWLTREGYCLGHESEDDIVLNPDNPMEVLSYDRKGQSTAYSPKENIEIANAIFENPSNFKKLMKKNHIKTAEELKAFVSVAKHSFDKTVAEAEKQEASSIGGFTTRVNYEALYEKVKGYVQDVTRDFDHLMSKAESSERN